METDPHLLDQCGDSIKALRMAGRQDHHRTRMLNQDIFERLEQERFFVLDGAAADEHRSRALDSERVPQTIHNRRRRG
jgi:hypothetical protein